jgi:hypothetical protein
MDQITFRSGEFQPFIATRKFDLGATGAAIPKGGDLLFDGSVVEFAGQKYSFPQLRGALRTGWIVPANNYDEADPNYGRPERANIQVRHATNGGNPMAPQPKMTISTTEADEREVMSAKAHAQQVAQTNRNYVRGTTPVNAVQPGQQVMTQHGFEVVEQQDGIEVPGRTLKTAAGERAKQERTTLTAESAAYALQKATNVQIEAGRGVTQEEMLERMTPEQAEEYLAKTASLKSRYVDSSQETRTVVNTVRRPGQQNTEGMLITGDVGHGIEIADPVGQTHGKKAKESVITEDGITFRTTNGPERLHQQAPNQRATGQQVEQIRNPAPARPSVLEAPTSLTTTTSRSP